MLKNVFPEETCLNWIVRGHRLGQCPFVSKSFSPLGNPQLCIVLVQDSGCPQSEIWRNHIITIPILVHQGSLRWFRLSLSNSISCEFESLVNDTRTWGWWDVILIAASSVKPVEFKCTCCGSYFQPFFPAYFLKLIVQSFVNFVSA